MALQALEATQNIMVVQNLWEMVDIIVLKDICKKKFPCTMLSGLSRAKWSPPEAEAGATVLSCQLAFPAEASKNESGTYSLNLRQSND